MLPANETMRITIHAASQKKMRFHEQQSREAESAKVIVMKAA